MIFELTRADSLSLHIAFSNFIASNIVCRLPHGAHSFVHCQLEVNATWNKLGHRDFIETDSQEMEADIALFQSTLGLLFMNDDEIIKKCFDAWKGAKAMKAEKQLRRSASNVSSASKNSSAMSEGSSQGLENQVSGSGSNLGEIVSALSESELLRR